MSLRNYQLFSGKRVLITGHTGFKGSWLSIWLTSLGANVIGYGLDPLSQDDNFELSQITKDIVDIRADIRDSDYLNRIFSQYKPEFVFHLAAQPLVKYSYLKPKETYEINVMGTLNVLEAIRNTETVRVGIMVTTDKCYDNKEQIWGYREDDAMGGYDPYSSSKGCAELLISSYRNSFLNNNKFHEHQKTIASVRSGNVIGGGDWSQDRLIPDAIKALLASEKIYIRNPNSIRPWQHVLEPLSGYLLLAENLFLNGFDYAEAWNFGPNYDSEKNVEWIVQTLCEKWGNSASYEINSHNRVHEASYLKLDCTKAKTRLNWSPQWSLDYSIDKILEWVEAYREQHIGILDLCNRQIDEYVNT
jgi:CDP-glucose 4,6-dehydratase